MPKTQPEQYRDSERRQEIRGAFAYLITYAGETFHLVRHDQDVTVTGMPLALGSDPQVFTRSQARHSATNQKGDIGATRMDVTFGLGDLDLAAEIRAFVGRAVPDEIIVTVLRFSSAELPGPVSWSTGKDVIFKGAVEDVIFSGQTVTLPLVSLALQGDGKVPRFYWQLTCQHPFGDMKPGSCQLDIDTNEFRLETTLDAASRLGKYVDISAVTLDANPIVASTFPGGKLWVLDGPGGDPVAKIGIVANSLLGGGAGTRLYLAWWDPAIIGAADVKVFRGCNRTESQCTAFGNRANYGGQSFIPVINPTTNGLRT